MATSFCPAWVRQDGASMRAGVGLAWSLALACCWRWPAARGWSSTTGYVPASLGPGCGGPGPGCGRGRLRPDGPGLPRQGHPAERGGDPAASSASWSCRQAAESARPGRAESPGPAMAACLLGMQVIARLQGQKLRASITRMIRHYVARRVKAMRESLTDVAATPRA